MDQFEAWDWAGVDIESEINDSARGTSVHTRVGEQLKSLDADVIFVDHGAGEIADFVAMKKHGNYIDFKLFHCKGSAEPKPGARVEDVYEVCGQAQKSVPWRSLSRIALRLKDRFNDLKYIKGDAALLKQLLSAADTLLQRLHVPVVHPAISVAMVSAALKENLGATSDHLRNAGFEPLRVIVSV
jgi:hypothetical protein